MSDNKKTNVEKDVAEASKGMRLRLAREARDMEVSDVAVKLYFEVRFIQALENDDYSIFAGSAYLYGYMRAYVKFLELPLDDFVCDLKSIEDENESHFENICYESVTKPKSGKWILPVIMALLVVIVIATAVLLNGTDSARANSIGALGLNEAQPDTLTVKAGRTTITLALDKKPATVVTHSEMLAVQDEPTEAVTSRLLLEYKTDSWTDIRDADGKRLVYRMVEKGNRLQLDSSPSYSILLGYAQGVNISWNDQPFNLARYERENIAYFVIGKKSNLAASTHIRE